jgi:hypothetical protein
MYWRRNFFLPDRFIASIIQRSVFIAFIWLAIFQSCQVVAARKVTASELRDLVIDKYIESTFKENSTLIKFPTVPKILSICPDTKRCAKLHWYMRSLLPREVSVAFSNSVYDPEYDLIVAYRSTNLRPTEGQPNKPLLELKSKIDQSVHEYSWGNSDCAVHQFREEGTIEKLVIEIDLNASFELSSACLIFELMRGTGANFQTETIEDYAPKIASLTPRLVEAMHKGVKAILRIHLSPLLSPGMTRDEARKQLQKSLNN